MESGLPSPALWHGSVRYAINASGRTSRFFSNSGVGPGPSPVAGYLMERYGMSSRGDAAIPTLDVIAADPARVLGLSAPERAALLGRCAAILHQGLSAEAGGDLDVWLTIPEVADRLRLAKSYVYQLARRRDLPVMRTGKYIRVRLVDLRTWAARLTSGPLEPDRYLTYHHPSGGRRASTDPQAAQGDAGGAGGAGRRDAQYDRTARARRIGYRRAPSAAGPTPRDNPRQSSA